MTEKRMTDAELTEEARCWETRAITPTGWVDAPDAVPRSKESTQINIRLPRQMVEILKEFARRSGMGYQVLIKRWLDEHIRQETERFKQEQERLRRERERALHPPIINLVSPIIVSHAAAFDASGVSNLVVGAVPQGSASDQTATK